MLQPSNTKNLHVCFLNTCKGSSLGVLCIFACKQISSSKLNDQSPSPTTTVTFWRCQAYLAQMHDTLAHKHEQVHLDTRDMQLQWAIWTVWFSGQSVPWKPFSGESQQGSWHCDDGRNGIWMKHESDMGWHWNQRVVSYVHTCQNWATCHTPVHASVHTYTGFRVSCSQISCPAARAWKNGGNGTMGGMGEKEGKWGKWGEMGGNGGKRNGDIVRNCQKNILPNV